MVKIYKTLSQKNKLINGTRNHVSSIDTCALVIHAKSIFNAIRAKKEVQIIQLSTGRVNFGSRWIGGLHEFVEVKEGLEPESESNTIASISHPSFFQNYETIFGLRGLLEMK